MNKKVVSPNPIHSFLLLLLAGLLVFLSACSTPVITTPENPTLVIETPTVVQTATATVSPSPLPPTLTPSPTPLPLPPSLKSLQLVYNNAGKIELLQEGKTSVIAEYEGEPQYMDYLDFINTSPLAFSDDGAYIAFIQQDGGIWVVRPDGTGKKNVFDMGSLDHAFDIRPYLIGWVPGTHILLFGRVIWLQTSLYALDGSFSSVNVDTGELNKYVLFQNHGANFFPSPDGKRIAVISGGDVYVVDVDGKNLRQLFTTPFNFHSFPYGLGQYTYPIQPIWEKNSQSFVFVLPPTNPKDTLQMQVEIWQVSVNGKPPRRISHFTASALSENHPEAAVWMAPDLSHLAYLKQKQGQGNLAELHIASMDLTEDRTVSVGNYWKADWAPGSQKFVIEQFSEKPSLMLVDVEGNVQELTHLSARDLAWIDDENLLLFADGEFRLVTLDHENVLLVKTDYSMSMQYFREFDFYKSE